MGKKSGGDGSRTIQYHRKTSGRPSMPQTSKTRIEFDSWAQGRDQPSGISPGATSTGSINTASRKSKMVKQPDSRRKRGNKNPEWKIWTWRSSNRK
jgi:hypothetical protein